MGKYLQSTLRRYCENNGIKFQFAADYCGVDRKKFFKWLGGNGRLNDDQMAKVMEVLDGRFLKTVEEISFGGMI